MSALSDAQRSDLIFAAGFMSFALGFTWFKLHAGGYRIAAAGAAALAGVLASRELMHNLLKTLSWIELRSALVLAAMTAIGLPLLPNHAIDPWGGFNPREVWLFTLLSATISFILRRGSRARLVKRIAGGRPGRRGRFIDRRDGELRAKSTLW